jgi:hypothetical protein
VPPALRKNFLRVISLDIESSSTLLDDLDTTLPLAGRARSNAPMTLSADLAFFGPFCVSTHRFPPVFQFVLGSFIEAFVDSK